MARVGLSLWLVELLLCCLPASAVLADERPVDRRLTIGAWNVQWLGNASKRPSNAPAQQAADLVQYVRHSRVDILALEEICDTDGDRRRRTNSTLDDVVSRLNRNASATWRYLLFAKKDGLADEDAVGQLTGVLWNTSRATLVDQPYRIALDTDDREFDLWQRHPHAIKFSAGTRQTDFVLIPLHLKSNRAGSRSPEKQRWIEAKRLSQAMEKIRTRFADKDIVLAGDTNILLSNERALSVFRVAGFRDLNEKNSITVTRGDAPFDRIFVPRDQPEFKDAELRVVDPDYLDDGNFFRKLSDHYMVVTTILVTNDDD